MNLYLTADRIGEQTGGGLVTFHESKAMADYSIDMKPESLGPAEKFRSISREDLSSVDQGRLAEPWKWDTLAYSMFGNKVKLAHIYSGTFSSSVAKLKNNGARVCFTIAAHDREVSRREHETMGWGFPYPHLVEPHLWQRYIDGYRNADVIVCPGTVPAETVRRYGPDFEKKRIEVIPHGCEIPEGVKPLPDRFTVGYMGSLGPDKGVRYLLEAWRKLNYKDALLVLAGRDSGMEYAQQMVAQFGGGSVYLAGWVKDPSDFYNSISLYVQPSATEGFGIEVLEAMAHGRLVLCSDGAGAVDVVREAGVGSLVYARNAAHLADLIDAAKSNWRLDQLGLQSRERASLYTWDKIRQRYVDLWRGL